MIIPWFICSTVIFFITSILGENSNEINFIDYIKFIFWYGSLYYFITILISMFIIFFVIKKSDILLYISVIITPINIILYYLNVISSGNQYLNLLNWISFFAVGYIVNKKNLHKFIIQLIKKNSIKVSMLFFISIIFSVIFNQYEYFTPINIITELMGVFTVILICLNSCKTLKVLHEVGEKSYAIYLLHIPVAGIVNILCNKIDFLLLQLLKPLIALLIIYNCINLYCILIEKIFTKNYEKIFMRIIGIRKIIINN